MKRAIVFLLFALLHCQLHAQVLDGKLIDQFSKQGVADANISPKTTDTLYYTTSDGDGNFNFLDLRPGRYTITVSHVSYFPVVKNEILIRKNLNKTVNILMNYSSNPLLEVEITEERTISNAKFIEPNSVHQLSVERTNRVAANYNDPARLATSYAGVVSDHDQGNNISVRGNSPNGLLWKLEGLEIVNPNHLTNAGTFSDRLSLNGGGVNILSSQLLDDSRLLSGAWSSEHGNAMSGVFDIHLRPGRKAGPAYTLQAGLLGIDLSTEGPFNSNKNSSYLINYRYSTVGLLGLMGVDLGDEEITFQDLSFNLELPTKKAGHFTLFGLTGISSNDFSAKEDSVDWEFEKDRYDINYESKMGAVGLTHDLAIVEKLSLSTTLLASGISGSRFADRFNEDLSKARLQSDVQEQLKLAAKTKISTQLHKAHQLQIGIALQHQEYNYSGTDISLSGNKSTFLAEGSAQLYQPYASWTWQISSSVIFNAGLHSMYYTLNESSVVEPRLSLNLKLHPKHILKIAYGMHSQLQLPGTYFTVFRDSLGNTSKPNTDLGFSRSTHYIIGLHDDIGKGWTVNTELYYQDLFDVPVSNDPNSTFSTINLIEGYVNDTLVGIGTGKNYGIEITIDKKLIKEYYLQFSSSFYNSTYEALDGVERDSRFNGNYVIAYS
ncbi:MAG: TonB-dependent receptor, partial [Bacteroidia bacterium]|nr:TonB-dependent receptor [Bacteroidia bacterium]